jgi:hypothetical protein
MVAREAFLLRCRARAHLDFLETRAALGPSPHAVDWVSAIAGQTGGFHLRSDGGCYLAGRGPDAAGGLSAVADEKCVPASGVRVRPAALHVHFESGAPHEPFKRRVGRGRPDGKTATCAQRGKGSIEALRIVEALVFRGAQSGGPVIDVEYDAVEYTW